MLCVPGIFPSGLSSVRRRFRARAAGVCLLWPLGAAAAAVPDTLVVRAPPTGTQPQPDVAAVVTRLALKDEPAGRDLAALLGGTAGFQVRRLGADGSSAIMSLRGSTSAQVRLYLDGMPLPDAQDGSAALDLIAVERIEAIEIHRGAVPAALGGAGGIGSVNLLTGTKADAPYFTVGVGSFAARSVRAGWGQVSQSGRTSVDIVAHARRAQNDFRYLDHNQTFHRADDDTMRDRVNAWVRDAGLWTTARHGGDRLVMRTGFGFARRDGGRPGPLGFLSPHASVRRDQADLNWRGDWDRGRVVLELAAGRRDERLDDPLGETGFSNPGTSRALGDDLGGRLSWSPRRGCRLAPAVGLTWRGQWQTNWYGDRRDPKRRRGQKGAYAALEVAAGPLRVTPTWRWQRTVDNFPPVPPLPWLPEPAAVVHSRDDSAPSIGAVWEVVPNRLFAEAHASRARREPSWVELFGSRGGIDGNRSLMPEIINSRDVAVTLRMIDGAATARLAAFEAGTDDKIVFIQNSQRTSKAINAGAVRTRGLEGELSAEPAAGWRLAGNLTWQDARDRSGQAYFDGKRLPFLPPLEARIYLAADAGDWQPWCEIQHMAANARDRADTELNRAPARTLVGLGLSRHWEALRPGRGVEVLIAAAVHNLTDNDVYDVEGFPLPGRTWTLSFEIGRNR